jgi:hypothetical protein
VTYRDQDLPDLELAVAWLLEHLDTLADPGPSHDTT